MKTTRINFYSGPGVGKSTTAARLFSELKMMWNKPGEPQVELISEYVKEWAWLKIVPISWDGFYIFAKQLRKEDVVLRQGHTHIITDSPLFMSLAYTKRGDSCFAKACGEAAVHFEKAHPSLHILLKRTVPYHTQGRYENYQQALEVDELVKSTLLEYHVPFIEFDPVNDFNQILQASTKWIKHCEDQ
jgi:hypothetical protein